MKQLDHDIDVFVRPRHPNIAQVFGVCRSPNLPAIIFHGSMRVPVSEYLDNIPAQDFIPFYVKFLRDIQSVSDHLAENYAPGNPIDRDLTGAYINEHGRLLVGNTISILRAGTVPHCLEIYLRSSVQISKSWIAQASHLNTSLRSRGYADEDGLYQICEHPYF
ncbi:hypothetical protein EV421DRAFT_240958 [Armillaria borealis]|uniref:Protein kinase domain-containing protein n=1 Tax=Armillaria borealis TaxID=47425 RepID=A0AA39IW41_9AGAR|nr:hypothetical protein EV421DRAFT_240958 [Armillaria borealis]